MPRFPARLFAPRYWLTWLGLGMVRLAASLPYPALLHAGRALGAVARRLPLPYLRVARRNMALCLPHWTETAREQLLNRHFAALGIGVLESALTWWGSDETLIKHSEVVGMEHLQAASQAGKGVILLTAHFTTLQIGARILNSRFPINALYRPTKNALIAAVSGASFARSARRAIRRDDVRAMISALRRNEVVWYAADQSYRNKGAMMVPFFGHPAATNVFSSRLAEMTGAAVLYYETERLPGTAGWRATIHPPYAHFPSTDALADACRYHASIEAQVLRIPEQYWWIHKRFKGLSADYPDHYGRDPPSA
ncbi:MAG: lipid A biosynthesis lauroyl acyltransferase [Pseudomonadota bacterium]|jgi:KDO2-lipid IV(A) lauroyltransferase